jgi:hypothetical protein
MLTHFAPMEICTSYISYRNYGRRLGFFRLSPEIILPPGTVVNQYWKYGREPLDTTLHWYLFDYDGTTGAQFLPDRVVLNFVDGLRGDDDLAANGIIVDPGVVLLAPNGPPTASAGADKPARAGVLASLDGSGSFDDNTESSSLTYAWNFSSVPAGSSLTALNNANTATASFTPDAVGDYVVQLVVTDDEGLSSEPDFVILSGYNLRTHFFGELGVDWAQVQLRTLSRLPAGFDDRIHRVM